MGTPIAWRPWCAGTRSVVLRSIERPKTRTAMETRARSRRRGGQTRVLPSGTETVATHGRYLGLMAIGPQVEAGRHRSAQERFHGPPAHRRSRATCCGQQSASLHNWSLCLPDRDGRGIITGDRSKPGVWSPAAHAHRARNVTCWKAPEARTQRSVRTMGLPPTARLTAAEILDPAAPQTPSAAGISAAFHGRTSVRAVKCRRFP